MKTREFEVMAPGLGLNTMMNDMQIKDQEASDLLNIEFVENGCPAKRRGTAQVGDVVGTRITGISPLYYQSGANIVREILCMNATTLKKLVNNVWTTVSGVTFTTTLNTNFTQARNALYVHNGTDNMAKYDGTDLTQPSTGVKARFGIFYSGYHLCAGNLSNPSRLYISNPLNAADFTGSSGTASAGAATTLTDSTKAWGTNDFANQQLVITAGTGAGQTRTIISNTATVLTVGTAFATNPDSTSQYTIATGNYVDISKDDGDKITGMGKWQDSLIVFKERSTYQFTFDATGVPTVKPINIGVGCVSHRSIVNVENDLFFLSRKGVYVLGNEPNYMNTIRTNELSGRVSSEIAIITPSNLEECSAVYYDYKYMLSIPQGGTTYNNTVLVYDRRYTCWSKWDGIRPNSFAVYVDPNNAEHVYFADDNSGTIWEMFVGLNDGGTAVSAQWTSKAFTFKENDKTKRWDRIIHFFRKVYGNVTISLIIDGDTIPKTVSLGTSSSSSRGIGTDLIGKTIVGQDGSTGAVSVGLTAETEPVETRLKKRGRTLKIKYSNNNVDETFTMLGFKPKAKIMKSKLPSSRRF